MTAAANMAEKTCAAWWVLETADLRGLPQPYVVRVTNHSTTELGVKTVDEFNTWAESLDVEPVSKPFGDDLHMTATGTLLDFEVVVTAIVPAAAVTR